MRTGFAPRTGIVLLISALVAVSLFAPAEARAQRLGVIGVGAFGRVGSVPRAFNPGVPLAIEATVQWPIVGLLHLATSADLTIQRIGTQTSFSSPELGIVDHVVSRPYAFDVVHVGVGPAFAVMATPRLHISGSAQAVGLVPSWGSTSVGVCGDNCTLLGPSVRNQQTEFHVGATGRLRFMFGSRNERLGFEVLGIVAPRHSASHLPLSSLAFMLVLGAS